MIHQPIHCNRCGDDHDLLLPDGSDIVPQRLSVSSCLACTLPTQLKPDSAVDHPAHYGGADNPYEAIKVIEAHSLGFCEGNAIKYILRAKHKGTELQDLQKAAWYIQRVIAQLEKHSG